MAKILIIDDDPTSRWVLKAILEEEGHNVSEAEDGEQGLALFNATPADLVITDIFMPEKEGVQTIRELLRDHPETRIIAVTDGGSKGMYEPLNWIQLLGVKHTFAKPYDRKQMISAVNELLTE
ncbi:MAG: response regulator [Desulfovibrio sp.]|uniref:response regulator n=1 Tax=Desulfovibrio sp. 7SRBS1 TaxID=3378064 RepID=UPI003B403473